MSDFELIITDDGSDDKTWEIISSYSQNDKRIRPIKNEKNIGLTKSLNKSLEIASGDFIARIDADDTSDSRRLERQSSFLEESEN